MAALATTLTMLVLHETRKAGPALSINEAVQLVNSEGGIFLDIRDAADYARGHITDALHIPALHWRIAPANWKNSEKNRWSWCVKWDSQPALQPKHFGLRASVGHKSFLAA